ncbi:hypothetical protein CEXT_50681 [Caerostris extrusa]|uniref:Uncharacterized protein n=1 Tax=Caerostris extrusa TaxID=172846 RepID=A0AAV4UPF9_CAEEX|nr:hypothetical protein CEXT_50681 [Caerostris extrusa]
MENCKSIFPSKPPLLTELCLTAVGLNHFARGDENGERGNTEGGAKDCYMNNVVYTPAVDREKHGTETEQRIPTGMDKSDTFRPSRSKV